MERLHANRWRQVHFLFARIPNGMRQRLSKPLTDIPELQIHSELPMYLIQSGLRDIGSQQVELPVFQTGVAAGSATTTTLLSLALVLLDGGLVVTQTLEVGKDSCLRHLTLEATQR